MTALEPMRAFYAGALPDKSSSLLDEAMQAYADTARAESLLKRALMEAPDALPVYFSLYKFYFYKGSLDKAEQAARLALETAARQGGFPADFEVITADSADWNRHDSPAHFYLFSLKALAFIRLRRGDLRGCESILEKLRELDQSDTVGGSVIESIVAGLLS